VRPSTVIPGLLACVCLCLSCQASGQPTPAEAPEGADDSRPEPRIESPPAPQKTDVVPPPPATRPTTLPASAPTTAPSEPPRPIITIGDTKIMSDRLDKAFGNSISRLSPERYAARKKELYRNWIRSELTGRYVRKARISGSLMEAENRKFDSFLKQAGQTRVGFMKSNGLDEDGLHLMLKHQALLAQGASDEAVSKFIKEHPVSFFDDTTVHAAHMLIRSDPYDPPEQRTEAQERAVKICEEIETGKITFEEAVKKYSSWAVIEPGAGPSTYPLLSKPLPFALAVDSLRPGQTSGPVEGPSGWYIIKVYERTDKNGTVGQNAVPAARYCLRNLTAERMITESLKGNPVTIHE